MNLSSDCDLLCISCHSRGGSISSPHSCIGEYSSGPLPRQPGADTQGVVVMH